MKISNEKCFENESLFKKGVWKSLVKIHEMYCKVKLQVMELILKDNSFRSIFEEV